MLTKEQQEAKDRIVAKLVRHKDVAEGVAQGRALVECFIGMEEAARPTEIVVVYNLPGGDGQGTKRWAGGAIDTAMALGAFTVHLYADGGSVEKIEIAREGGEPQIVGRAEWEERVGLKK